MSSTLYTSKLLLLDAIVIILLLGVVLAQFALPAKYYDTSMNTKSDVLDFLGNQVVEKQAGYIAVDKYAMSEPFSSELLITYSTITSKADINKITR